MTDTSTKRVLVVDDEEDVCRLVTTVLGRCGYQVVAAASGSQALDVLTGSAFDLMVTDLKMPGMTGLELLEHAQQLYPRMAVIVLTAYGTIQTAVTAMKRGAVDYMTKPFDIDELEQKVAASLQQQEQQQKAADSAITPLVELTRILSSDADLADTLDAIIDLVRRTFQPAGIEVTVFDASLASGELVVRSGARLPAEAFGRLTMSDMQALAERERPWVMQPARDGAWRDEIYQRVLVPLLSGAEVVGALALLRKPTDAPFNGSDGQLLQLFGAQVGMSMLHARTRQRLLDAFRDLRRSSDATVRSLAEVVGTYDQYTREHSERVATYARMLGQELGLPEEELDLLQTAGLLHDLGKLGVADDTLHKNGRLTLDELDKVKLHPVMGARIIEGVDAFRQVVPIVLYHHERWDGSGYPEGLSGPEIPMMARIVAVVDTFDALTSDRPYRNASTVRAALDLQMAEAGVTLDRELVVAWRGLAERQEVGWWDAVVRQAG